MHSPEIKFAVEFAAACWKRQSGCWGSSLRIKYSAVVVSFHMQVKCSDPTARRDCCSLRRRKSGKDSVARDRPVKGSRTATE